MKKEQGFQQGSSLKGKEANAPWDGANGTQDPPQAQPGGCLGWTKEGENGV